MKETIIGIDLGGTNFRIGVVDEKNQVHSFCRMSSERLAQADDPVEELNCIIEEYVKENHITEVSAVSIGVPSSVENDKKTVICTTNIRNRKGEPVFENYNIADAISSKVRVPVYVNNDTKNILLYDMMSNGLEDAAVVVGIYIGTGVGSAVWVNGDMLDGKDGAALDLGHIPYYNGTAPCSCGKSGCCECYASGWKLEDIQRRFYPDTPIREVFEKYGEDAPLQEFVRSCAHVFSVMATIFNPDALIAGGGVLEMKGFPRETFEREVNKSTGKDVMSYGLRYVYSEDTDDKGVVGAAIFARKRRFQA